MCHHAKQMTSYRIFPKSSLRVLHVLVLKWHTEYKLVELITGGNNYLVRKSKIIFWNVGVIRATLIVCNKNLYQIGAQWLKIKSQQILQINNSAKPY